MVFQGERKKSRISDGEEASFQVVCPFMLDQFYWAERMYWLGLVPEPLKNGSLAPDEESTATVERGACIVSKAVELALSPNVKSRAVEMAYRVSMEVLCFLSSARFFIQLRTMFCPALTEKRMICLTRAIPATKIE